MSLTCSSMASGDISTASSMDRMLDDNDTRLRLLRFSAVSEKAGGGGVRRSYTSCGSDTVRDKLPWLRSLSASSASCPTSIPMPSAYFPGT